MHKNKLGIGPTHSCTPERSRSHSCTHIVTRDFKLIGLLLPSSPSFSRVSVCYELWTTRKCIQHYVCWLFLHQIHFLFATHRHTTRHLVAPAQQLSGDFRRFWLANSSLRERVKFGSLDTRVRFARDREWPAERFFRSSRAKIHSIRVK